MVHSTLSMHSETVQQPRTLVNPNFKPRPTAETRILFFK
jgi:hypothetical protein